MKKQVLLCDMCAENGDLVIAVERVAISTLYEGSSRRDLCEDHYGELREALVKFLAKTEARSKPSLSVSSNGHLPLTERVYEVMSREKGVWSAEELLPYLEDPSVTARVVRSVFSNLYKNGKATRVARGRYEARR